LGGQLWQQQWNSCDNSCGDNAVGSELVAKTPFVATALIRGTFATKSMEHLQQNRQAVQHMWQQF
jgi:hypothetical protein